MGPAASQQVNLYLIPAKIKGLLREAAKKVLFLAALPLKGGRRGGKGLASQKNKLILKL